MRNSLTVTILGLGLCLTACGSKSDRDEAPEQVKQPETSQEAVTPEQAKELDENFTAIPQMAIVRIALDADGNPDLSVEPELRTANATVSNDATAAEAFDTGATPESIVSSEAELDADSSTQSWFGWGRGCYTGYGFGCYSNFYRPRVWYGGYTWRYNYGGFYNRGGYGYYCYNRYRWW